MRGFRNGSRKGGGVGPPTLENSSFLNSRNKVTKNMPRYPHPHPRPTQLHVPLGTPSPFHWKIFWIGA